VAPEMEVTEIILAKQNIDETHSKQPKINRKIQTSLWILKLYLKKKIRLAYGFIFFVISISKFKK
jgi:hypothetical protein